VRTCTICPWLWGDDMGGPGVNGAGKVTSEGTVVIMTIFKMVEKGAGSVRVRVPRGVWRTRTTPARKRLWPRSCVCPLKQPALIANLRSQFQNGLPFGDYTHKLKSHTHFPDMSIERRHVVVTLDLQLKHWRRTQLVSFTVVSSV
jgi:hypothetical protein